MCSSGRSITNLFNCIKFFNTLNKLCVNKRFNQSGLEAFVPDAWNSAICALGEPTSKFWTQVKQFFPTSSRGLLDGSLYSPAHLPSRIKLGKIFLKLCTRRKMEPYQLMTGVAQMSSTLSKSDILHANTRSLAGSIFNETYTSKFSFEFLSESYVSWCCFFLGLPPVNTLGNHTVAEGFDYPVQKCQSYTLCLRHFWM